MRLQSVAQGDSFNFDLPGRLEVAVCQHKLCSARAHERRFRLLALFGVGPPAGASFAFQTHSSGAESMPEFFRSENAFVGTSTV